MTVGDCDVSVKRIRLTFTQPEQAGTYTVQNGLGVHYAFTGRPAGSGTKSLLCTFPRPLRASNDHAHFFDVSFTPAVPEGHVITLTLTASDGKNQTLRVTANKG